MHFLFKCAYILFKLNDHVFILVLVLLLLLIRCSLSSSSFPIPSYFNIFLIFSLCWTLAAILLMEISLNFSVKLKHFQKFTDTTEALAAATATVEGKVSKTLKKTLKKLVVEDVQNQLLVADAKLGNAIKEKVELQCVSNNGVQELLRCIRSQSESLLAGLPKKEMTAMALGLAHSLSRYKLKFSPDKIDTMIVQAQCLLDDLDKELNNYMMRAREW